jgi:hypothetical protein
MLRANRMVSPMAMPGRIAIQGASRLEFRPSATTFPQAGGGEPRPMKLRCTMGAARGAAAGPMRSAGRG